MQKAKPNRVFAHVRVLGLAGAVEEREQGRPGPVVLLDETGQRVSSASPAALRRSVRPGMSRWEAQRRCPDLVIAQPNPEKYRSFQQQMREVCADYTPQLQWNPCGDGAEVTLDLTGAQRLFGEPREVGLEIRNRLRAEIGVFASIGVGPTPLVAQLAARVARPGEVREVLPEHVREFVGKLPIAGLPGVDSALAGRLEEMGLKLARDLAALPADSVARALGDPGRRLWLIANGEDPVGGAGLRSAGADFSRPTGASDPGLETISGEMDLRPPTEEKSEIRAALRAASEEVARQLRAQGKAARLVHVEIVFRDMRRVDLRRTLGQPTRSGESLYATARTLFDHLKLGGRLVRRVRVRVSRLTLDEHGGQLALPLSEQEARRERLAETVERVRDRFGAGAVRRASMARLAGA